MASTGTPGFREDAARRGRDGDVDLLTGDRRLLEGFRAGEDAAPREVFRHYAPLVARSVRRGVRITKGRETMSFRGPSEELEVERVVQETFSRAFSDAARSRYDGVTPYAAYLCRVARNFMITEAQVARRTPQPPAAQSRWSPASCSSAPTTNSGSTTRASGWAKRRRERRRGWASTASRCGAPRRS